jgi:hypothetical protein
LDQVRIQVGNQVAGQVRDKINEPN